MKKVALITGVTGQDGAYLAELLLDKGYTVHGIKRRTSLFNTDRIDHLYEDPHEKDRRFILHHGDMTDSSSLTRVVQQVQPNAFYASTVHAPSEHLDWGTLMYFSFTVLTSTGFGEITPVTRMARALIVIEQVVGVMYVAFLIARLANLYGTRGHRRD